jgi:hypothetical protein
MHSCFVLHCSYLLRINYSLEEFLIIIWRKRIENKLFTLEKRDACAVSIFRHKGRSLLIADLLLLILLV